VIIVGEKINSSIHSIKEAIEKKDYGYIIELAKKQYEAGASYIDVNAGAFIGNEAEILKEMIKQIQVQVDVPLSIDSSNPDVIKEAMSIYKGKNALYNSITYDDKVLDKAIPVIKEYDMSVITLLMENNQIPESAEKRLEVAKRMVDKLNTEGVALNRIFIDPMVQPLSVDKAFVDIALDTIKKLKEYFVDVNIICGLSNISYGLPSRKWINRAFLVLAIYYGLNSAILNPLDTTLIKMIWACEALAGVDEYCLEYIAKAREGLLD